MCCKRLLSKSTRTVGDGMYTPHILGSQMVADYLNNHLLIDWDI